MWPVESMTGSVVVNATAQIGGQTGTIPDFPQFYESFAERDCDGRAVCEVGLGLVPANSLFMATDIMCHAFANSALGPGTGASFTLKSGTETLKNVFRAADVSHPSNVVRREYVLHESLLSFFAPGSRPTISFSFGSVPSLNTNFLARKLAGNLVRRE